MVIPQEIEAEVLDKAEAKATAGNKVRKEIEAALSSTEAIHKYGVL